MQRQIVFFHATKFKSVFSLCMFAQAEKYAGMGLHRTAVKLADSRSKVPRDCIKRDVNC